MGLVIIFTRIGCAILLFATESSIPVLLRNLLLNKISVRIASQGHQIRSPITSPIHGIQSTSTRSILVSLHVAFLGWVRGLTDWHDGNIWLLERGGLLEWGFDLVA